MLAQVVVVVVVVVVLFHERGNPFSQDWYKWGTKYILIASALVKL